MKFCQESENLLTARLLQTLDLPKLRSPNSSLACLSPSKSFQSCDLFNSAIFLISLLKNMYPNPQKGSDPTSGAAAPFLASSSAFSFTSDCLAILHDCNVLTNLIPDQMSVIKPFKSLTFRLTDARKNSHQFHSIWCLAQLTPAPEPPPHWFWTCPLLVLDPPIIYLYTSDKKKKKGLSV